MAQAIYIDMDGTLCRFHDTEHQYIEKMWEKGFYKGLKPFEEFVRAVSLLIDRNPNTEFYILSAVLHTEPPFAEKEKREWISEHLPQIDDEHIVLVPAGEDKSKYIGSIDKSSVLIDDYNKNLREWENAGGLSIKFVNDINNRGLGAYGGETDQLWDGESVSYNQSAMTTCLHIENIVGLSKGERAFKHYGFDEDVLPTEFIDNIDTYFAMRCEVDKSIRHDVWTLKEYLKDFSGTPSEVFESIDNSPIKMEKIKSYQDKYSLTSTMINSLENCYTFATINNIPPSTIKNWIYNAVTQGRAFTTYPVSPSNIVTFLNSQITKEARINALYEQIKEISRKEKKLSRRITLPTVDEVVTNLVSGDRLRKNLTHNDELLSEQLTDLLGEWKELTGTNYPNILQGKTPRKYFSPSQNNQLLK